MQKDPFTIILEESFFINVEKNVFSKKSPNFDFFKSLHLEKIFIL